MPQSQDGGIPLLYTASNNPVSEAILAYLAEEILLGDRAETKTLGVGEAPRPAKYSVALVDDQKRSLRFGKHFRPTFILSSEGRTLPTWASQATYAIRVAPHCCVRRCAEFVYAAFVRDYAARMACEDRVVPWGPLRSIKRSVAYQVSA